MADYVPLFQTAIWALIAIAIVFALRKDVRRIRDALVTRVERGAALGVGPISFGELRAEVETVKTGLERLEGAVAHLFLTTMSEAMFENLRKLATGSFGPYHWSDGLGRELYHLRDIGYLSVRSIRAIPRDGAELSQHVSVTDPGKKFVALRLQLKSQSTVDSDGEFNT